MLSEPTVVVFVGAFVDARYTVPFWPPAPGVNRNVLAVIVLFAVISSVGDPTSRATSISVGSPRATTSCSTAANTTASSTWVRGRSNTVLMSATHISARRST